MARGSFYFVASAAVCLLMVNVINAHPQWVWNKNLDRRPQNQFVNSNRDRENQFGSSSIKDSDRFFIGQSSRVPVSSGHYPANSQSRLIPGAINAISNSIQSIAGGGGFNGGGGGAGGILNVLGSVPQLIAGLISGASSASNLPAKDPGDINTGGSGGDIGGPIIPGGSNSGGGGGGGGGSDCTCTPNCFIPYTSDNGQGSCGGGSKMCCKSSSGTRIQFEGSNTREQRPTRNNRDVQLGLLTEIIRGSGRIVDDTIDLIFQRYLTDEDHQKLATRLGP